MQRRLPLQQQVVLLCSEFLAIQIFFSTFSRLCKILSERYPSIQYGTEPGISSITAFAAASSVSLNTSFVVSDGKEPDSRILLKVRNPRKQAAELKKEGYSEIVLVERMYFPDMKVYRNEDLPEKVII